MVGGDIFRIQAETAYPEDYDAMVKGATKERESGYKPPLKSKVQDIGSCDIIFHWFSCLENGHISNRSTLQMIFNPYAANLKDISSTLNGLI